MNVDFVVNDVVIGLLFIDFRGSSVVVDFSIGFVVYNFKVGDKVRVNINGIVDVLYFMFLGWRF